MALTRVRFAAGRVGQWKIDEVRVVRGETLPDASRLAHGEDAAAPPAQGASWVLEGVRSRERYSERGERESAGRGAAGGWAAGKHARGPRSRCARPDAWWQLAQDERRAIFEERSHHIAIGARLPARDRASPLPRARARRRRSTS